MVNFFISWSERLRPWLKKLQPGLKQLATMVITRLSPVTRLATCLSHIAHIKPTDVSAHTRRTLHAHIKPSDVWTLCARTLSVILNVADAEVPLYLRNVAPAGNKVNCLQLASLQHDMISERHRTIGASVMSYYSCRIFRLVPEDSVSEDPRR